MAKKNCRMTDREKANHDRAVSLRKMTDAQLCDYVEKQYKSGVEAGMKKAPKRDAQADAVAAVEKFIAYLETRKGSGNRIGGGTIYALGKELTGATEAGVFNEVVAG